MSDISDKNFRYIWVCVDSNLDDYIDINELEAMLDNALGGANESTVEALAFATQTELDSSGRTSVEQAGSKHFIAADTNGDRTLTRKEAKAWLLNNIDGDSIVIEGQASPGQLSKYFRVHFWPETLGARFDEQDKTQKITYNEFLTAFATLTLVENATDNLDLSAHAPPDRGYVPEDPNRPPMESEKNDGAGLNPKEMTDFIYNELIPWFNHANAEGGICSTLKHIDHTNGVAYGIYQAYGTKYPNYNSRGANWYCSKF